MENDKKTETDKQIVALLIRLEKQSDKILKEIQELMEVCKNENNK